MDSPATTVAEPPAIEYSDRSTGLTVFGIILIVLGLLCLLIVPFTLLSIVIARKTSGVMPAGVYVMSIGTYVLAAAVAIALGVGSIRKTRWGRNLTLVASWLWLFYGSVSLIMITVVLPAGFVAGFRTAAAQNPKAPPLPAGIAAVILTFIIACFAVFFVVLPIIFVVFYRRKDVAATCQRLDPGPSWTEQSPLPVLAASMVCALGALYYFQISVTIPVFPFFGRYLTGLTASVICIGLALLEGFLSVALFRKKIAAWWIAVGALLLRIVALALTVPKGNLLEVYSRMGYSAAQIRMIQNSGVYRSGGMLWFGMTFLVAFLAYLFYIKKYFSPAPQETPPLQSGFPPLQG
jgi:hypothetical protein